MGAKRLHPIPKTPEEFAQARAQHESKIDRLITQRFTRSYMSNTKWRKAFRIVSDADPSLTHCYWKFIDNDRIVFDWLPKESRLLETYLMDGTYFGPTAYREIEWIEIPRQYLRDSDPKTGRPPEVIKQNVEAAVEALNKAGYFPIEETEAGIKIYGYS